MNFSKNASKQQKAQFSSMWLTLWRKTVFLIFIRFYMFNQKKLLKEIQIFLRIFPFSNMVRKTNFLSISVLISTRQSLLCLKRKVLYEFLQKCFKTTERHSLAVCGLLCGEKQFLLIFICFYRFNQKQLLKQIKIFLRIFPFTNMVRKTNFPSFSLLVSEISLLFLKRKVLHKFLQKCYKKNRKAQFSSMWHTLWRKTVFVYIYALLLI